MKIKAIAAAVAAAGIAAVPAVTVANTIPSVVVTVENAAPARGANQTPFWVGFQDGTFDLYDRNVALGAGSLVPAPAVERLAEDGNTGPLTDQFAILQPQNVDATILGPSGPFTPGDVSSTTLNVNPETGKYFSYASMIIPSNDFFIANGNPLAHQIFDDSGNFVAQDFSVTGAQVLDAGTEVDDEIAANTAFLNQAAPDTGVDENGAVELAVETNGFAAPGTLPYPDGVLNHPAFGIADFLAPNYRAANFSFRFVDQGAIQRYTALGTAAQEVSAAPVASEGFARVFALSNNGDVMFLRSLARRLTGDVVMAHLHLGQAGTNGPVVVNLTDRLVRGRDVRAAIRAEDVITTGTPFEGAADPMLALLNEAAAGNIYLNLHTEMFPAGEIRAQLILR